MSVYRHHSIVVVGHDLEGARAQAVSMFKQVMKDEKVRAEILVGPVQKCVGNEYESFFIAPDGGSEGSWLSQECEKAREDFLLWLYKNTEADFVEVEFGGEDYFKPRAVTTNDGR